MDKILEVIKFIAYMFLIVFSFCGSYIYVEDLDLHNVFKGAIISISLVLSIYIPLILADSYE